MDFGYYKEIKLEKMKVGMEWRITRDAESYFPYDEVIYRITGYVLSQDAGKKVSFRYPSDWWEAFKERWFTERMKKKYPVKYTIKTFEVKATYPDLIVDGHNPILRLFENTDYYADKSHFTP